MQNLKNNRGTCQVERREIFSIRKFSSGVASALIGVTLFGSHVVLAEEVVSDTAAQHSVISDGDTGTNFALTGDSVESAVTKSADSVETENTETVENASDGVESTELATETSTETSTENTVPSKEEKVTNPIANSKEQESTTKTSCCQTVKQYQIVEDKDKEFGYAEKTPGTDASIETITLGVKPKVEEVDNTIRTTRYEARSPLYDKDAYKEATPEDTQIAPPHVVENIDGLNKIEKGQYTDLLKAYETVEAKSIQSIEDTLQVQQFGEEGVIDLNKVLEWMEKQSDKPVMTEFKMVGSDNSESYLAVFKGSDGRKWVSTNKSEYVMSTKNVPQDFDVDYITRTEKQNNTSHARYQYIHGYRAWAELTPAQHEKKPSVLGGLYNLINSNAPREMMPEESKGAPLLTVINDSKNIESRHGDNKAYLYNHRVDTKVTYSFSYRTVTRSRLYTGEASPFASKDSNRNEDSWVKSSWKLFDKKLTLKPHVSYHPEVVNKKDDYWNRFTDDERMKLAQNEYRRAVEVDIKPKTERVMIDGKEYYKYTEYSLNQKTGEKVILSETLAPVEEIPKNQSRTNFVTEGVAMTLPKLVNGNVELTHKALLQAVYDRTYMYNKQSILEDYYGIYDARQLENNPVGYGDLFTGDDTVRRATELDNRKATYNTNHRPIREDVRREILGEIADKNAPFFRNVTLTPNVTVNHYLEDGTLLKTETKAATVTLDPYFKKGSPEFLKDYTFVRSTIDEQEYIYKRVANPKYYTKGFNLDSVQGPIYESMGTVAPPYTAALMSLKASPMGSNAGFALTYDNYAIVEPVSHERAQAVRKGQVPDYCVAEEARHIRTINVYYKKIPRNHEVPNDFPTVTRPEAEMTKTEVKGKVVVRYVDENGKVIAKEQTLPIRVVRTDTYVEKQLAESVETHEPYDTTTTNLKPAEIPFEGKTYYFTRVHKDSQPETGEYKEGTQYITYVYKLNTKDVPNDFPTLTKPKADISKKEVKGNVVVHYVDEHGKVIAKEQTLRTRVVRTNTYINGVLAGKEETDERYDTTTETLKPAEIPFEGKTYYFARLHKDSQPETGEYKEGTQHITYVYKLNTKDVPNDFPTLTKPKAEILKKEVTGNIVVHYVDEHGKVIAKEQTLATRVVRTDTYVNGVLAGKHETDERYDTTTETLKPAEIPFEGGQYRFIRVHEKSESVKGEYKEGTLHVTYVYKLKTSNVPNDYPTVEKPILEIPEDPTPEGPKPEGPKPEEPKSEEPKSEEPKPEGPKPEEPKPEEPKPEEPKPEEPKPEGPKPEEPKPEEPKPEEPKPEGPKPEEPKPEEPKPEEPKPEGPKPEEPKPEEPKPEEPKPEGPKPEEPKSEEPKPDRPKPEGPKPEEPTPEAPKSPHTPEEPKQRIPEVSRDNKTMIQKSAVLPNTGEAASFISWGVGVVILLIGVGFVVVGRKKK
ncbi:MucBP domain-containing protein [Tuanshanicoccus lijuaniae]|uniref:MucBP domain-containing protein n=1 Tax=Aerococcaceae bacterium zg-1292 TaxID=2774330 RepID=UPI001BD8A387|nr:MucBP domain-containing protein [Aerococcaceae bacterium zg-A91]MBS4457667.1 MucBP domain-containing protein [Aerococcaceae bacterium zg-BR33]